MAKATQAATATLPPALRDRLVVVDDFLPVELAEVMRLAIDEHFATPEAHGPERQVWNYWFVPELYAYLRTAPEKLFQAHHITDFHQRLRDWSIQTLGLAQVSWPFLSLYVSGCRQGLHNDARNGRFGYVYSLTRNQRRTSGGETIVHREGDPSRRLMTEAGAGPSFFDAVEPRFNRLVVFDDRLPHAVERIDGSMDPREGRLVLHGHLSEGGPLIAGPLRPDGVAPAAAQAVKAFAENAFLDGYHGLLTLRLDVRADGAVTSCRLLLDRVLHPDPGDRRWAALANDLMARFCALTFPPAADASVVIVPLSFGAQLPPLA